MDSGAIVDLFSRLHGGEARAWDAFVAEVLPQMIAYLERSGLDHHMAEDIAQEVLGTVFSKLSHLRDPVRLYAWVRMIARNRLRSRYRRVRFTEPLDDDGAIERRDALVCLQGDELCRVVREEVCRFGLPVRRMLELKLLEDRTPSEVAAMLGMPPAVVRRRYHVALKTLRARMARRIQSCVSPGAPTPESNPLGRSRLDTSIPSSRRFP